MTKKEAAIQIRNAALSILREQGTWATLTDGSKILETEHCGLKICLRSQFQRGPWLAKPDQTLLYQAAVLGIEPRLNLPNGLDIWAERKKVLNIEWDNADAVNLISFKRGTWEGSLVSSGTGSSISDTSHL